MTPYPAQDAEVAVNPFTGTVHVTNLGSDTVSVFSG